MAFSEMMNSSADQLLRVRHYVRVPIFFQLNCYGRLRVLEENLQDTELLIVIHLLMVTPDRTRSDVAYLCTFNPVNVTVGSCRCTRPCCEALRNSPLTGRPLSP